MYIVKSRFCGDKVRNLSVIKICFSKYEIFTHSTYIQIDHNNQVFTMVAGPWQCPTFGARQLVVIHMQIQLKKDLRYRSTNIKIIR